MASYREEIEVARCVIHAVVLAEENVRLYANGVNDPVREQIFTAHPGKPST